MAEPPGAQAARALAEARLGARTILPVLVGAVPFALVFGALAVKHGLSPLEVGLMSGLVYAGAAQFAAVELWSSPAAIGALGLTAFLINLRHVLMGMALAPHLAAFPPHGRALALFTMADENWALAMRRAVEAGLTPAFYAGMAAVMWAVWVTTSVLGALLGAVIEDPVALGFDFAFVAVFMALLRGFWTGRDTLVVWAAAALTAIVVARLAEGPWYVIAGALAGVAAAWLLAPTDRHKPDPAEAGPAARE